MKQSIHQVCNSLSASFFSRASLCDAKLAHEGLGVTIRRCVFLDDSI
jgi:hypothetical protein